jgi:hypothetical protein
MILGKNGKERVLDIPDEKPARPLFAPFPVAPF